MSDDKSPRTPGYYRQQAARLRALAATATTPALKARLLEEAETVERIAAATEF